MIRELLSRILIHIKTVFVPTVEEMAWLITVILHQDGNGREA